MQITRASFEDPVDADAVVDSAERRPGLQVPRDLHNGHQAVPVRVTEQERCVSHRRSLSTIAGDIRCFVI